jgi:hypothetical protein
VIVLKGLGIVYVAAMFKGYLHWLVRGEQGCQMVYFKTKNPNLGKLCTECLAMKDVGKFNGHLVYFTIISYILWPLRKF